MSDPTDPTNVEPDDVGDEEGVPADLVELHEILEWQAAVDAETGDDQ